MEFINSTVIDWRIIQILLIKNSPTATFSDLLPEQNWVGKLAFLLLALGFFFINKQITIIPIAMQTQAKFCLCFTKVNTKIFLCCTNAAINIINWFFTWRQKNILAIIRMRWWTVISTKIPHIIPGKVIAKTPQTCSIKCYSIATIHVLVFITIFYYVSC